MRATTIAAAALCLMGSSVVLAQTPQKKTEGPGLKASEDSRYQAEIAQCRNSHPAPFNPAAFRRRPRPAGPVYQPPAEVEAIPGVIAAGQHWRSIWHESGNNADGIVGLPNGDVLVAQQDFSDVVSIDPLGHAKVTYRDTNTGGAVSISKDGHVFVVERGLHQAIYEVAPERRKVADTYRGDSIDCLGNFGLNDLTAAANGGVYFTVGGLYYAAPDGTITREGTVTGTNGIILSADEKTLYVTSGTFGQPHGELVAFDVQPDGMLTNQRVFAQLTGAGDGSTIDSDGRIYVTSGPVIDVISPDGKLLGVIPGPKGDDLISVAFGGRGKHTLYAVGLNHRYAKGGLGLPSDTLMGGQGGELIAIPMLAHGYEGRAK